MGVDVESGCIEKSFEGAVGEGEGAGERQGRRKRVVQAGTGRGLL